MTKEELKSLTPGEVVVITKLDKYICHHYQYKIGDRLIFSSASSDIVNLIRVIAISTSAEQLLHLNFNYGVCDYIVREKEWIRNKKLDELGI